MYLYVLYGTFTRASTNLNGAMNSTFYAGGSSPRTNAADSSIAHTPLKKRKQIKEKARTGERSQTECVRNTKSKIGGKNNIKLQPSKR